MLFHILYCILYDSIKNLQFLIINLYFLSKLLLAWILEHFIQTYTYTRIYYEYFKFDIKIYINYIYVP